MTFTLPRYGLYHPTWEAPSCFYYFTADDAKAAILKVYGPDSGHVVVEERLVP